MPPASLSKLTDGNGNLIVQYTYDAAGNLIQKDMGNGTRTVYTYDAAGNVLSITNLAPTTSRSTRSTITPTTRSATCSPTPTRTASGPTPTTPTAS